MVWLGLFVALVVGVAAGWVLRPRLEARAQDMLPFLPAALAEPIGGSTLAGRVDAAISEIESQLRQGIDRERNGTRLQILREVKDGN